MPVVLGEPSGQQRALSAPFVIGPLTLVGNLAANTSTAAVQPMTTGSKQVAQHFNFIYAPLRVRAVTGYINANAVAAANTITLTIGAAASNYGGTELPATRAGTGVVVQGGFVGRFSSAYPQPIGLPGVPNFTVAQGCTIGLFALATAAGAVDIAAYLHLEP